MTPRSGLYVALVGLIMAGLCLATLFLLRDWKDPEKDGGRYLMIVGTGVGFMLLLDLGALLGLIFMTVGLAMAGVLTLTKKPGKPS
jgi:hypothetical protein